MYGESKTRLKALPTLPTDLDTSGTCPVILALQGGDALTQLMVQVSRIQAVGEPDIAARLLKKRFHMHTAATAIENGPECT